MNRNIIQITISAIALLGANSLNAAIYSNTTDPTDPLSYALTLDTGSTLWQNKDTGSTLPQDQNVNIYSTYNQSYSSWTDTRYDYSPSPVVVDPKVGVEGSISYYREVITEHWSGGGEDQSGRIGFRADLDAQSTPSSYTLEGSFIQNNSLYSSYYDSLNFSMGMNSIFDPSYTGGAGGTLSFFISSTPGDWTFAFHSNFDATSNNISLSNNQYLDLSQPVYFMAQYDIFGTEGDVFDINNLYLNISGYQDSYGSSMYETSELELYNTSVIPALAPVPVPAAAWLFGSGLIGLVGVARRKKSAK